MNALLLFRRAIGHQLSLPRLITFYILAPVLALWLLCQLFGRLPQALAHFPAPSYLAFIAPALAVAGAVPLSVAAGLRVIDDRDTGVLEQLLATPVSPVTLVLDEVLARACGGMLLVPVALLAARAVGMPFGTGLTGALALLPPALAANGLYAAVSLALAAALPRRRAVLWSVSIVVCVSVAAGDLVLPSTLLPSWLITIAHLNPLAYAVHAARVAVGPAPAWALYMRDLLVLGGATLAAISAALALIARQASLRLTPAPA